jgi:hypothetical protein
MCSRQYNIQYDSSGTFVTRTTVNNSTNDSATTADFAPVTTSRIRYNQPANMGSALYPTILWITEMEIYLINDMIPPAAPSNVRGNPGVPLGSIDLQWTAPGDPPNFGQASGYEIRYSHNLIDESNWDAAQEVVSPPLPLPEGSIQNFTVGGLNEGETYYIGLKAADAFGNVSGLSDIVASFASGETAALNASDCLYPKEGNTISTPQPTFTVRRTPGVNEVYIEVDSNNQFGAAIQSGVLSVPANSDLNWRLPVPLESKITYFWRVSTDNATWTSPISFSSVPKIHVFPNPFNAAAGDQGVTFTNLPQNSEIIISTISGTHVRRVNGVGPNDWFWDVKNDSGQDIAPGVYMYLIDYEDGSANGKVIVAR